MAGQKGGAKQLVWLTYERSRSHHLGCIIQANNPKGDCDLRARANQSLRSHFSVEHARTVGWTVAATACAKWGTSCLPVPSNQPRCFICESPITWSALVAATPRCVPLRLFLLAPKKRALCRSERLAKIKGRIHRATTDLAITDRVGLATVGACGVSAYQILD